MSRVCGTRLPFLMMYSCAAVNDIQVAIVPGFHLFPSRTEKLSPAAPMVLRNSGRVGSRRFFQVWVPSSGNWGGDSFLRGMEIVGMGLNIGIWAK